MKTSTDIANAKVIRFDADDTLTFTHNGVEHVIERSEVLYGTEHRLVCTCGKFDRTTERGWTNQTDLVTGHAENLIREDAVAERIARIQEVARKVRDLTPIRIDVSLLVSQAQKALVAAERASADYTKALNERSGGAYEGYQAERVGKALAVFDAFRETLWLAVEGDDLPVLAGAEFTNALLEEGVLTAPAEEVAA